MTERLKSCRFCGETQPVAHDHAGKHFVLCSSCDAQGPPHPTRAEAVAAWNRAHDEVQQPAPVPREVAVRLAENLDRTRDALDTFVKDTIDPGTEALSALYCADAALRAARAAGLLPEGGVHGE